MSQESMYGPNEVLWQVIVLRILEDQSLHDTFTLQHVLKSQCVGSDSFSSIPAGLA